MRLKPEQLFLRLCSVFVLLLLVSCSGSGFFQLGNKPAKPDPSFERTPPPLLLSAYEGGVVQNREDEGRLAEIDLSSTQQGFVVARCISPSRAKFMVKNGKEEYIYDLYNDGTYEVFPLSMGSGNYKFTVFINLDGETSYEYFLTSSYEVRLKSEQAPFERPNQNVHYEDTSQSVALAYEIAKNCQTDIEVVAQVYDWVQKNMSYDQEKADKLDQLVSYRPNLDEVITERKGICYDYASLVAALLRINGVACQLVKGDVQLGDKTSVYHAWNMIWLQEKGWVAVQMPSRPEEWAPLDLTFAATLGNRTVQEYFEDRHYTKMSVH